MLCGHCCCLDVDDAVTVVRRRDGGVIDTGVDITYCSTNYFIDAFLRSSAQRESDRLLQIFWCVIFVLFRQT
jgi:hypothetical protein